MASSRTHTLTAAARFSDSSKARFHYFLNNNADKAVYTLHELSKKQARQFSKVNKEYYIYRVFEFLSEKMTGKIYIKKGNVETNFNLKPLQFKASL